MLCDHCTSDTDVIIDAYYDLQLCSSCNSKHLRQLKFEQEAIWELAYQQRYLENNALSYVYDS